MNEQERDVLRQRLLGYPGATPLSVERQLDVYEEREKEKLALTLDRRMSNALAESYLDKKGYPRPPGWHSVFFYPGGGRPRNGYVLVFIILIGIIALFFS